MHNRGSRDMMGRDESWWQSRTGLEQKLIILSTVLFIVTFSLTITVIVFKNRSPSCPDITTPSPTDSTTSESPTESSTASEAPPTQSSTENPETPSTSEQPPESTSEESTTEVITSSSESPTTAEQQSSTESSVSEEASTATTTEKPVENPVEQPEDKPAEKANAEPGPGSIQSRPSTWNIPSPKDMAKINGVIGA